MIYQRYKEVHLTARNEGKLKVYESCCDLRAWSHDPIVRDQYAKEWMKSDMPSSLIPFKVIFEFWKDMTYKKNPKFAPRCNPDCRSKDIIESIYVACKAASESLKNDKSFQNFFEEEEFETSHWPYEKCIEPLKNIRMFWKIIVEKIFHVKIPRKDEIVEIKCDQAESMRSIIKDWERDILEQISYAKKIRNKEFDANGKHKMKYKYNSAGDCYIPYSGCSKSTITDINYTNRSNVNRRPKKCRDMTSRYASIKVKTADVTCGTEAENSTDISNHLDFLQQKLNMQNAELERLNRENRSLRIELNSSKNKVVVKKGYLTQGLNTASDMAMALPLPFDSCIEEGDQHDLPPKDIDSEMIITMKNCKNDNFKNISLLQVIHKSNKNTSPDIKGELCCRKEYPLHLLNSVNNTFGPILRRELAIARGEASSRNNINVHASFKTLNACRSNSSLFSASSSHFMSTKNSNYY